MVLDERQNAIIEYLRENRRATVRDLAELLFVSEATVRRDLTELQSLGILERSHGGAILQDNAEEISIFVRMNENAKEKELAATNALPHIPKFGTVFIDSSSTALALAERMDLSHKTVVTNNIETAIRLSKKRDINLIILGGSVQYNTVSATGSYTVRQLEEFSFDLVIASCAAVRAGELYERSIEQKEIKLAAFKRSKYKVLVFGSSKYEGYGAYKLGEVTDFDLIATDKKPTDPAFEGVKVIY